ncbi:MAG: carbohydrate ABC transporter permease [Armatimonadota bacterium]|nr:carbohydrate ABC transporter permease [Armatimonadota bacterium]
MRRPADGSLVVPARARPRAVVSPWAVVRRASGRVGLYAMLTVLAAIFLVPYLWMVASSLRPQVEIFRYVSPLSWRTFVPEVVTFDAYRELFRLVPFPFSRYLMNSVIVATAVTGLSLMVNAMAAYAFARLAFPGRDVLFALFLGTMIVPFEVLAIPLYLQVRALGWVNTYQALIIPWVANPLGIFLLRQFFQEIPRELEEAARIDGCSYFGAFRHVVLPNAVPALVAFALIRFQASWDAFLWPLIAAPAAEKRVIQVAIASFVTEVQTRWDLTFAASTLATVPIIVVFLILQRYYVQGVVMSGLKG